MFHDFPYTDFHELNLDYLMCLCKKSMGLKLQVVGDNLRLVNANGEVISNVTISYAEKALNDVDGRAIQTYIFNAGTDGTHLVFTHGDNTVTSLTVPYSDKAKMDIQGKDLLDYVYGLSVAGDKLRITKGDATITEITVPYAIKASTDINDKDITTYACVLATDGNELVLRDSLGRELSRITPNYAEKANKDVDGDAIKATYGTELSTGSTTVKMFAKDGTLLSEITVPYATDAYHADEADHATVATDATNAVEQVTISGDQIIFTTYGGQQFSITAPYAVKAQKDSLGNIIKSTYVASVTSDPNTGTLSFLDAENNVIVSLVPTLDKAIHDSYNNLIADYVKQILVDVNSNYVTVTHGTGNVESLTINYSTHAWKDTNENVIKNTYIKYMECVEDVDDGHYKLVCYDGDNPMAELFRIELLAYAAQCDVNGRELVTYVGNVLVDADDSEILDVLDGEDNVTNQISGAVTVEPTGSVSASFSGDSITPSGSVSASASGTAVSLTAGTLPSVSYDSVTETLTFNAGVFPTVNTVTDPTISASFSGNAVTPTGTVSASFTGNSETENVVFSDSI